MESIEFKIQLKGKTGASLAFITAYNKAFKGHRFILSTGIKVKAKGFDAARPGKVLKGLIQNAESAYSSLINEGAVINNDTLKNRIELIRKRILWVENELQVWQGSAAMSFVMPDGADKEELTKRLSIEITKQRPDYQKVIDTFLSDGQNGLFGFWESVLDGKIKSRYGKKLRKQTVKSKRQTLNLVKQFDPGASFNKMDMHFYNSFTEWMGNQKKKIKGKAKTQKDPESSKEAEVQRFDTNSIGKHIKDLKAILRLAYRNDLIDNTRFEMWSVTREKNEVVTLNKDELLKMNSLKLSGTIEDVRDIFVIASFLGPRISDYPSFNEESLTLSKGVRWFEYVQEKTGARVKVPIHPIVEEILQKRSGKFPKMISEQNFRYHLKDICKQAEFNDRVIVKIRDGKPEYKKKHQAISPHTARRIFASNLFYGWFGKPMPASFCMRYTGHKTEKSFMIYIGANEDDIAQKAMEYFDLQPVMKAS